MQNAYNMHNRTVVFCDYQSGGIGRNGRHWISPRNKSLLFSILLKPDAIIRDSSKFTCIMALAIAENLESMGINAKIKWPNDVVVNDKKIAGILAEAAFTGSKLSAVVISAGLNVLQNKDEMKDIDRPASSIYMEIGKKMEKRNILLNILDLFFAKFKLLISSGFEAMGNEWQDRMTLNGRVVSLTVGNKTISGKAGFPNDGSIEIVDELGNKKCFNSGEVAHVKNDKEMIR